MSLNYGSVLTYKDKGYGFVSPIIPDTSVRISRNGVYFHISMIKSKYPELAQKLDNGLYRDVSFWYMTEHTPKGEQATDLWLKADEIPSRYRIELEKKMEKLWLATPNLSAWLHNLTVELLGQPRCDELLKVKEQLKRTLQIKEFCAEKHITNLVHFTRIENLQSILKLGLLSREILSKLGENTTCFNDELRLDKCANAVCLSVSFPNYKMFYKYRCENSQQEWVVLFLSVAILWELDCAFCKENAASNAVTCIPISDRKQISALRGMFEVEDFHAEHQNREIDSFYTINPQAEVLVFDSISPKYIEKICFNSEPAKQNYQQNASTELSLKLFHDSDYFSCRDWVPSKRDFFKNPF